MAIQNAGYIMQIRMRRFQEGSFQDGRGSMQPNLRRDQIHQRKRFRLRENASGRLQLQRRHGEEQGWSLRRRQRLS